LTKKCFEFVASNESLNWAACANSRETVTSNVSYFFPLDLYRVCNRRISPCEIYLLLNLN